MNDTYIVYKRTSDTWKMDRYHFHEQYEILLSLSENADMFVTDRCYPLQYGSLILLSPAVLHRSVSQDEHYNRYVIRFSRQYAESLSTNTTNLLRMFEAGRVQFQLDRNQTQQLSALYEKCIERHNGFGADLRQNISFVELMLYVENITSHLLGVSAEEIVGAKGNITTIINYISGHLCDDLSLDALASRFFISKPHLCRVFKEYTGFSLGEYIIKVRIMRARTLLQDGKSVQEAGEEAGFKSYAHFIRTFRQQVGVSPGKYKNQEAL